MSFLLSDGMSVFPFTRGSKAACSLKLPADALKFAQRSRSLRLKVPLETPPIGVDAVSPPLGGQESRPMGTAAFTPTRGIEISPTSQQTPVTSSYETEPARPFGNRV